MTKNKFNFYNVNSKMNKYRLLADEELRRTLEDSADVNYVFK